MAAGAAVVIVVVVAAATGVAVLHRNIQLLVNGCEADRGGNPVMLDTGQAAIASIIAGVAHDGLLRNYLLPFFGNRLIGQIRDPDVRRWRKERLDSAQSRARNSAK